ncbi:MAG: ATP-binding protein [Pseudomonadota bacterium]
MNTEKLTSILEYQLTDEFMNSLSTTTASSFSPEQVNSISQLNCQIQENPISSELFYKKAIELTKVTAFSHYSIVNFDKAIELEPKNSMLRIKRGETLLPLIHQYNKYVRENNLDKAREISPYIFKGDELRASKSVYDDILQDIEFILSMSKNDINALTLRGTISVNIGNLDAAEKDFLKVIDVDQTISEAFFGLGKVLFKKNDKKRYIRHDPDLQINSIPVFLWGSEQYFEKTIELAPNNAIAHYYLGCVQLSFSNYKLAIQTFNKIDLTFPSVDFLPRVYEKLSKCYELLGDKENEVKTLSQLLKLTPTNINGLIPIFRYQYSAEKYAEALATLKTYEIAIKNDLFTTANYNLFFPHYFYFAITYEGLGKLELALDYYQKHFESLGEKAIKDHPTGYFSYLACCSKIIFTGKEGNFEELTSNFTDGWDNQEKYLNKQLEIINICQISEKLNLKHFIIFLRIFGNLTPPPYNNDLYALLEQLCESNFHIDDSIEYNIFSKLWDTRANLLKEKAEWARLAKKENGLHSIIADERNNYVLEVKLLLLKFIQSTIFGFTHGNLSTLREALGVPSIPSFDDLFKLDSFLGYYQRKVNEKYEKKLEKESQFEVVRHIAHSLNQKIGEVSNILKTFRYYINDKNLSSDPIHEPLYDNQPVPSVSTCIDMAIGKMQQMPTHINRLRSWVVYDVDETQFQEVNLYQFFTSQINELGCLHKNYTIELTEYNVQRPIRMHKGVFTEAIRNLLTNAEIHGFKGDNQDYYVSFRLKEEGDSLIIDYINNGDKFPKDIVETDFLKLKTPGKNSTGEGLGGAWIGKFIDSHKGEFEIINDDHPVHFRIKLPITTLPL